MVKCPDGSSCPGNETCCELASGGYGCCGYEKAVCCSDGLHCCPHGTTCDVKQGTCIRKTNSDGMSAIWSKVRKAMVKCPDGSSCPGKETCCKLASEGYGCCGYEEAVCCSDGLHCCPHGTTCDVKQGTCIRKTNSDGISAIWSKVRKAMVKCPDESSCPGNETCCELASGGYGCCGYEEAVCCSDGLHCCPHGTTCDVKQGTCIRKTNSDGISAIWSKVRKAMVKCPDESSCPGKETCCKLASGGYGCCGYEEAVCCSDGLHCCPHGTTCILSAKMCLPNVVSFLHINPPKTNVEDVVCPDGISSCPTGDTCCKLKSGDFGCCPLVHAVCCSDGLHCCPKGTTCDLRSETCISEGYHVKMDRKLASFKLSRMNFRLERGNVIASIPKSVICPDGKTECKDGNTCCLIGAHTYGCCPMKNAVCCSDMKHCCPNGFTCGPFGRFHLLFLAKLENINLEDEMAVASNAYWSKILISTLSLP